MKADPLVVKGPALVAFELSTVARGMVVLDAMVKRAEVDIVAARTLSPGRYLIIVSAPVAEAEEARDAALQLAGSDRVDDVLLFDPAGALTTALADGVDVELGESLLMVETTTLCALLLGLDRALKEAEVDLMELRLGAGLSGKGVATLTGPLHMGQAAQAAFVEAVAPAQCLRTELLAQPHPDLPKYFLDAEAALPRGRKKS